MMDTFTVAIPLNRVGVSIYEGTYSNHKDDIGGVAIPLNRVGVSIVLNFGLLKANIKLTLKIFNATFCNKMPKFRVFKELF